MISEVLPKHPKVSFEIINKVLTKKEISNAIDIVYRHCGQKTVIFADKLGDWFKEAVKLEFPLEKMTYLFQKTKQIYF